MRQYRIVAENRDTGVIVLCAVVSNRADANRKRQEYAERFPNDIVRVVVAN